ncbi:MAG: NADH-quinone oxidoreductase subunit I [Candidatus Omnitrophica bacterium]|nr:NADH-quinone oxidoreductase subunit I [Candidatus Omnitrophota bacterium]
MSYGLGILKGMSVTLKQFVESYTKKGSIVTVQYPEERREDVERFRNFPILVYDEKPEAPRCVACDICAKECPPKCITIVRDRDEQGRGLQKPKVFDIDLSVCMSCGICEEVCPFDAIFMDHQFELSAYDRMESLNYHQEKLLKPNSYLHQIRPTDATQIDAKLKAKEEAKKKTQPGTTA